VATLVVSSGRRAVLINPVQEHSTIVKKKNKRTVMYSSAGKKLYAVRDAKGEFMDIQTYKRAQGEDEQD
jgi:hypothetical protein